MEALKNDKLRTLNKVFAFLDVEQMNDMARFDFVRNTRSEKKVQSLLFKSIYNKTLSGLLSTNLKLKIKQSWIGKKLFQSEVKKIEFTEQDKSKLRELLSDDVANLKNFTGYSFDEWSF